MYWSAGGKETIQNMLTLCHACHEKVHKGALSLGIDGTDGFADKIAQRTMQGKAYMYEQLRTLTPVSTVYGYQTADWRRTLSLAKTHDTDAMCIATLHTGEIVPVDRDNFYTIKFRPRQTRRQYHDLPRKHKGRVRYQVNTELEGFCILAQKSFVPHLPDRRWDKTFLGDYKGDVSDWKYRCRPRYLLPSSRTS